MLLAGKENVVCNDSARAFFEQLGTQEKELRVIEESDHGIQNNKKFIDMFLPWIFQFIEKYSS